MNVLNSLNRLTDKTRWAWFRARLFMHWIQYPMPSEERRGTQKDMRDHTLRILADRHAAKEPRPPARRMIRAGAR